jgi:hypothetical protein
MGLILLVAQFVLVLATISLLLSLPPVFCRDSKGRATNNNSRVLHSPALVDVVLKLAAGAISIAVEAETTIKARAVPVLLMILTSGV